MGSRRIAREAALQILFQLDYKHLRVSEALRLYWKTNVLDEESKDFAERLVVGVDHNIKEIDSLIEKHSTHWKISRMSVVDRNTLRMAIFELLYCEEIPSSVTLNEAIEIGKKFGTEDSGAFINGILDQIAKSCPEKDSSPLTPNP